MTRSTQNVILVHFVIQNIKINAKCSKDGIIYILGVSAGVNAICVDSIHYLKKEGR